LVRDKDRHLFEAQLFQSLYALMPTNNAKVFGGKDALVFS
jgi:hypothetical protein